MKITINGTPKEISQPDLTISRLLELEHVESPEMVSVQRNGVIIEQEEYESTRVTENDEIDFLYFMGGGAW